MKKWSKLLTMGLCGLLYCGVWADTPYLPITVNLELSSPQFEIKTKALNTPTIRFYLYQGTNLFSSTGYVAHLSWGKDSSASSMVTTTGVVGSAYTDFNLTSNKLAYPVTKWYCAMMLTKVSGEVFSLAYGYMTILPSPEVNSTAVLSKTYAINGSEYGPFTGDFSGWPFLTTYTAETLWTAASNKVVYTNDARLTNDRSPTAHNQGYATITNAPWITNAASDGRYFADSVSNVMVLASDVGITAVLAGTTYTFTIPSGVKIHSARIRWPGASGTSFKIVLTETNMNTTAVNRIPAVFQAYSEDTGAPIAGASCRPENLSNFGEETVWGLLPSPINSCCFHW